ncbi:MAG: protoporphyrinogen oxidase, partial [Nitrospirae bacterium]|nr:protoporphyrinogen oxidase [Nitrospirota bacterium]
MSITIVGGGISGLSLAYFLLQKDPGLEIQVLEAENRPGGKICSDSTDGFLCERGVNGFLDNKPLTLELARSLSLNPLRSNDAAKKRFIYSRGRLYPLPESPQAFLFSGLLSPCGRGRIFYEVLSPKGKDEDETLASFAKRRLGKEAYEKLIDPMASGIYAGDPERMSLKSCFPRIHELERKYGSLIKALLKLQKAAKKSGKSVGPGPGGRLTSFYDGMETLVKSLRDFLGQKLLVSKRVTAIDKRENGYNIYLEDGSVMESDMVILACPAYAASEILRDLDPALSAHLSEIPYPAVSVACLGFRQEDIGQKINGFGFLVPASEKRKILGTLWDSSIFPNRAPEGYVLLRSMIGGARATELALEDEERVTGIVLDELRDIMGIDVSPDFVRIYRHEKAIP